MVEDRTLVKRFWDYYRLSVSEDRRDRLRAERETGPEWLASDEVIRVVHEGRSDAPDLLRELAESASTEEELAFLGAGPLEEFADKHPDVFTGQLLRLARVSPKLRTAMGSMVVQRADLARRVKEFLQSQL